MPARLQNEICRDLRHEGGVAEPSRKPGRIRLIISPHQARERRLHDAPRDRVLHGAVQVLVGGGVWQAAGAIAEFK
eukprot:130258-Rhodomonas_salina.1